MLWEHCTGLFWPVVSFQLLRSYITENITCIPHTIETSVGSQLQFQSDLQITHMYSGEGEEVTLYLPVWPTGNVENWLREVEKSMKATLRDNIDRSLKVYPEVCDPDSHFDVFSKLVLHFHTISRHILIVQFLYHLCMHFWPLSNLVQSGCCRGLVRWL